MSLVPRLSPKRLNDILSRKVIEVGANVTLVGAGANVTPVRHFAARRSSNSFWKEVRFQGGNVSFNFFSVLCEPVMFSTVSNTHFSKPKTVTGLWLHTLIVFCKSPLQIINLKL